MATTPTTHSFGQPVKRKEDGRFIQGRGNYLDDHVLPKMIYMALVRSPYGHAKINNIDTSAALKVPGVKAVITAKELAAAGLDWMPTLAQDKQMVLAGGKVLFQYQEVAAVFADTREAAADGVAAVQVDYAPLPAITDPYQAMAKDAPILREDREKKTNHIWHYEVGDQKTTADALSGAPVKIKQLIRFPRCHPSPLEPCGCIADFNGGTGRLTFYVTSQAPHAHRTVISLVSKVPESNIRVVSPDIGGGFGNKVPVYPGYVCAIVGSLTLGVPVKWVESRTENLASTHFARDYWMETEIGATKDGKVTALKVSTLADHGAFDGAADPTKYPAGLFSICTGSYDFPTAFVEVDGYYTNKAPGGIAYRCSFRVTEASYCIERAMDILADELKMDPVDLRRKNFIPKNKFPYPSATGWTYDSGDYEKTLDKALQTIDYKNLLKEQAENASAASCPASASPRSPRLSARVRRTTSTSSGSRCSTALRSAFTRPAARASAPARKRKAKATRRPGRRSSPKNSVSTSKTCSSKKATLTPHHTGSAHTRAAAHRSPAPRSRWQRARYETKPSTSRRTCSKLTPTTSSGPTTSSASRVARTAPRRCKKSHSQRTRTWAMRSSQVLKASRTTTRRT